jgi:DNA-directed RNA polymerase subunit RPC12/RpoP
MKPNQETDDVRCPKCGSAKIHAEKRGWSMWVGFMGSGKIVVTCLACGHRFKPGEGAMEVKAEEVAPKTSKLLAVEEDERGIPTFKLD